MPVEGGGYLPPVVIEVTGDDTSFLTMLEADKAALLDFAKTITQTQLGADSKLFQTDLGMVKGQLLNFAAQITQTNLGAESKPFQATIGTVKAELLDFARQVTNARIGGDAVALWATIAEARVALDSLSPFDVDIEGNLSGLMAKIAAAQAALDSLKVGQLQSGVYGPAVGGGGGGGGGGSNTGGAALGEILGGALWGSGGGSFVSRLLSPLTTLAQIFSAKFGSLGSLAGFGPEHLALTGVGLAGSAAGGALGGGLLAAGALGVNAVGLGTDLAGIGQASGDIKMVTTDMANLKTAIADYGAGSLQASVAQNQLNYDLASFNPIAKQAVLGAVAAGQSLQQNFDKYTGSAEKIGAQIITSLMNTAQSFLPEIGKAATANMAIIQSGLAPLLSWLKGPGLAIFTTLENKFTSDLPTAMHAFDQAVELVIRTLGFIGPMTGNLTDELNRFFTKWNGADFSTWEGHITNLISLFRTWDAFIKILVKDIAEIFGLSAGLGKGIIQELTGFLNELHKSLQSAAGGSALSSLFTTHKAEMIQLIKVLVQVGDAFTQMYLIAAPTLVTIATLVLRLISGFITLVSKIPGGAAALGLALILTKLGIMAPLLLATGKELGLFSEETKSLGAGAAALAGDLLSLSVGEDGVTVATGGARVAMIALQSVGILAVAVGIYELIQHFGVLRGLMIAGAAAVGILTVAFIVLDSVPIVALIVLIGVAIAGLVAGIIYLATHWSQVWAEVKQVFDDAVKFLRSGFGSLALIVLGPIAPLAFLALHWQAIWSTIQSVFHSTVTDISNWALDLWHDLDAAWQGVTNGAHDAWSDVINFLTSIPGKILAVFIGADTWLLDIGKNLLEGLVHGLEDAEKDLISGVKKVGSDILGAFKSVLSIFSPSAATTVMGGQVTQGLTNGITSGGPAAIAAARQVANAVIKAFGDGASAVGKSLNTIKQTLGSISGVFTSFESLAKNSGKITVLAMFQIYGALETIKGAAPALVGAINGVVSAFQGLDKEKKVGSQLSNLDTVLSNLSKMFGNLASASQNSSQITVPSLQNILNGLNLLMYASPAIVAAVKGIEDEFGRLGSMKTLNSELSALSTLFSNLSGIFANVGKASQTAGEVTPQALSLIVTALQNLTTAMAGLPAAVNAIGTQTIDAYKNLVANSVNYLNSTGVAAMHNAGINMMEGLAAGINSVAGAVATAAQSAATNAIAAVHTVTKPGSPSRLYTEEGQNWMLGLILGVRSEAGNLQAALTSSIPHVGQGSMGSGIAGGGGSFVIHQENHFQITGATDGKSVSTSFQKQIDMANEELIRRLSAGSISSGT